MDEIVRRYSLQVHYKFSFYGFSVASHGELLDILKGIRLDELEERLVNAVKRSPYIAQYQRDARLVLGALGNGNLDDYVLDDIAWHVIETQLDIEYARDFLDGLRRGSICIVKSTSSGLSPLARKLVDMPSVKPWIPGIVDAIAKMLRDYAFTVIELSEALGVSEKTIESKLKDMRSPEYGSRRVVSFIDVDEGERRWTLVESLLEVSLLEEFTPYFRPRYMETPLRLRVKRARSSKSQEIIVTPSSVLDNWKAVESLLPEEMFVVEISNAYYDDEIVRHYNVPLKALPLLILNAAVYLERPVY